MTDERDGAARRWYTCPDCGKRSYPSRKVAKRALAGVPGLSFYECGEPGRWHAGHLPKRVKQGRAGRLHRTVTTRSNTNPDHERKRD